MLIAYVDESYDREFYFIGAAVATMHQWECVSDTYSAIRRRTSAEHGTDPAIEFHAHELMGGIGAWGTFRGRHREAAGVYIAALQAAEDCGVRYLFRGVDVARLNARYRYPRPPHAVVFQHLLEQIDAFTEASGETDQTIIVADQIATQSDHQRAFAGYQSAGVDGAQSARLERISAPINFASSAGSDGLQAIDLAVYIHFRRERINNTHPTAKRTLTRQWRHIESAVAHNRTWCP